MPDARARAAARGLISSAGRSRRPCARAMQIFSTTTSLRKGHANLLGVLVGAIVDDAVPVDVAFEHAVLSPRSDARGLLCIHSTLTDDDDACHPCAGAMLILSVPTMM